MLLARIASTLAPPICAACGAHAGSREPLCADCRRALRWLGAETERVGGIELWAPLAYEGPARAIVATLKFRGALALAQTMAAQVAAGAPPGWLAGAQLVPVPLHPARRRRRGFNQTEALARAIASRTGLPVADCLERAGRPSTQVGSGRSDRLHGIAGAVELRPGLVPPRRAVIVDDVATTGATLAACAAALRREGSREVRAVAYARTPGR